MYNLNWVIGKKIIINKKIEVKCRIDWVPGIKCNINVDVLDERQKKMAFHIVFN
jgi:hypothetical protein